jgi:hypothetical protein
VLDATVASIYLPAAVLRGERPSVSFGPQTQTLRVEIELPSTPPMPAQVDITLRALSPDALTSPHWSQAGLRVQRQQGTPVVSISAPARFFPDGPIEAVITPHVATPSSPGAPSAASPSTPASPSASASPSTPASASPQAWPRIVSFLVRRH